MMHPLILTINAGSSSIKFALFDHENLEVLYHGKIDSITTTPLFLLFHKEEKIIHKTLTNPGYPVAITLLVEWLKQHLKHHNIAKIAHRIVHGGAYTKEVLITAPILKELEALIPLAPLHQPHHLEAIQLLQHSFPEVPHIACFDTSFHHTIPSLHRLFALPKTLTERGIKKYGFHGLSYHFIAEQLTKLIPQSAAQKSVIIHLGNGASMCALKEGKSYATTMGFSALEGLMMGTRCGRLDPGVMLYLQKSLGMMVETLETVLYQESGLLGVSGISHDMRLLLASDHSSAREAIELFIHMAIQHLGSLIALLGGIDAIIFTGGIGENSAYIRQEILRAFAWLGIMVDSNKNQTNEMFFHTKRSKALLLVIPTNEEYQMAKLSQNIY